MEKKSLSSIIVQGIFIIYYLAIAVIIFVMLTNPDFYSNKEYLGYLVLAGSIPHLVIYFINGGYKSKAMTGILIIGIVGFALGFVFVFSESMTIEMICLYWGILDICRGAIEIGETIPHVKHNKLEILEIGISTGDIILGVLLCIHLEHGIKLHLIYFGIAFILYALKIVVELLILRHKTKNA